MNTQYPNGTRLMIELSGGKIYEGTFCYGDNMKITVSDVSEYPENIKYDNLFHFYKMEIESITIIDDVEPSDTEVKEPQTNISMEYDQLKELSYEHKYISVVDNRFHSAIDYLKICTEIAVFGFGNVYGRNSKVSLLAIGTKKEIFLFDVKLSGERVFDLGLRDVLEAEDINKAVHDSKTLADCLQHIHKVTLKNVYDTQVADYMISQKDLGKFPEKMRIFADCVHTYLNIPASIIKNSETSHKQLMDRPVTDEIKLNCSLQVAYLYTMKNILNKKMLLNFNKTAECFLNCMRDEDHAKSLNLLKLDVPSKVKELNLTL